MDTRKNASKFTPTSGMMPIVIQKTATAKGKIHPDQFNQNDSGTGKPSGHVQSGTPAETAQLSEPIHTRRIDTQGPETTEPKYKMMQLDDDDYSV